MPYCDHVTLWEALHRVKATQSQIPGELPASLRGEFLQWLVEPLHNIVYEMVANGEWPAAWKAKFGTSVPKESLPIPNEDSLRIISISHK